MSVAGPPGEATPELERPADGAPESRRPSRWELLGARGEGPMHGGLASPPDDVSAASGGSAAAVEGDFRPTARLFLRALGVVYLVAFASLAVQAGLLVASDGLLPVHEFLAAHQTDGVARL